jgi:lysophospholipase L1-like esterase
MKLALLAPALLAALTLASAARAQSLGMVDQPCVAVAALTGPARQAADFGGLCRYDSENAHLPPATTHRVILFGDSITELWKLLDPTLFTNDVLDRGVSGQTTSQMLIRFRADVIDLHPRVVQIMAGTNDVAGNTGPISVGAIENNIRDMVELARAHHITVVLASIPPAAKFTWQPSIEPISPILSLNAWLRALAKQDGLIYVDYYALLVDDQHAFKADWSKDGVHPNAAGYAAMEPLAKAAIEKALGAR